MKKSVASLAGALATLFTASYAFAQGGTEPQPTLAKVNPCPEGTQFAPLCDLNVGNAIPAFLTTLLVIAVVIALFFLLWGGIKWIASSGDKGKVESARGTVIAAIVGLIIVFASWFIMDLLLKMFGLGGIGIFAIPQITGVLP